MTYTILSEQTLFGKAVRTIYILELDKMEQAPKEALVPAGRFRVRFVLGRDLFH